MSFWRLVTQSLWFYRRTNLAVLLAVMVAIAVLTGALVVGDSVQYTLRRTVEARLGQTEYAVIPQDRFFRAALADDLQKQLDRMVAPVLQVTGIITNADGSTRVNRVDVLGVDERFYRLGPGASVPAPNGDETVTLGAPVADRLAVSVGDEIVLRVEKPGLMPRDVPLASDADRTAAFRLKVQALADDEAFGRFDLKANQAAPLNVFVPLAWLGEMVEHPGQANILLAAAGEEEASVDQVNAALQRCWRLADAGLELRPLARPDVLELRSGRIFIDQTLADAALKVDADATGILTYFVNQIALGDKVTPYSMVAAINPNGTSLIPRNMSADQIVINQWLADDLGAKVGDSLELTYYLVGLKRNLVERTDSFTVAGIVPLSGAAIDPNLTPDFPGLANVDNCRDWEAGIPIDLDKIRTKDETYWDDYRGTPKAFITLEAGQALWGNRFGNLTAVRCPWREGLTERITTRLTGDIDPATVGLFFQPVRQRGLAAGREGTDFGQLFLGLSMFLIASALILTGLLFVFGVESRSEQVGTLLAVGLPSKRVGRILLAEGGLVALAGTIVGVAAGLVYTRLMVYGLSTLWRRAVAGTQIDFFAKPVTLSIGGLLGLLASLFAIWITLRKKVKRPARELLGGDLEARYSRKAAWSRGRWGLAVGIVSIAGAVALVAFMGGGSGQDVAGVFFGAGSLLLIGALALCQALLRIVGGGWNKPLVSLSGLGLRNSTRRSGRSLAIIGLLACGVFLVVSVQIFRQGPVSDPERRDSGTGGFAFYGELSVAVLHDLNTEKGRVALGLNSSDLDGASAVQLRVRAGDDASCLNLNRAQQPRLLGVETKELSRRGAFTFVKTTKSENEQGWNLLKADLGQGVVPAVGDKNTLEWALGKNIGDELEYKDEAGRAFSLRIVGMIASSILQGSLVIDEAHFVARFPSEAGYSAFLVDAPGAETQEVGRTLTSGLRDFGLVLTPAAQRLAAFSAVENTYLSIFTVLGGLGLILGCIGLGLIVLRNMLERRGELAMLRAVGFSRQRLGIMVFYEHWGLVLSGLICGVVAAAIAVIPAVQSPGGQIPYFSLLLTVVAIGVSGGFWVWIAAALALRGELLDALRNE
ncbi:MAG: ABC transporter permease [Sedimentisphaerales bacterium]|nr:ABC transporter permease [Sedimentisphaerales bacterium]